MAHSLPTCHTSNHDLCHPVPQQSRHRSGEDSAQLRCTTAHQRKQLAANLAASTTADGITIVLGHYYTTQKSCNNNRTILTSGNGSQCTRRTVHLRNDHCHSQAAQSSFISHPMSFQTSFAVRVRAQSHSRAAQDNPAQTIPDNNLHTFHCRTVSTTSRPIKCRQTSLDPF